MLYAIKFSFRVVVAVSAAMTAEELLVSPGLLEAIEHKFKQ